MVFRLQQVCLFCCLLLNSNWDWPVKGVELHGQHRVCLQCRVWVIGRWSGLLSQLPTVDWRCHQALQDLLHFRESNKVVTTKATETVRKFNGLTNYFFFYIVLTLQNIITVKIQLKICFLSSSLRNKGMHVFLFRLQLRCSS